MPSFGTSGDDMSIKGPISVRVAGSQKKIPFFATTILLLEPTGSGKSNFIECLSGDSSLGIARDQLDRFTQGVTAYEVMNVKPTLSTSIYLIDAPGFADCNIPELEVVNTTRAFPELVALLRNELSNVKGVLQAFEADMEEFKDKSDLTRSSTSNSNTNRSLVSNKTFQRAKGRFQQLWRTGKKTEDSDQ